MTPQSPGRETSSARRQELPARLTRARNVATKLAFVALIVVGVALLAHYSGVFSWFQGEDKVSTVTAIVKRASLPIMITAGGELESSNADYVVCELEGKQINIVEMVPEGTFVKAGDVVMKLDPSEINDRLAAQQLRVTQADAVAKAAAEELKIQQNLAASKIAQAQLALTLADLDQDKYLQGDYEVEFNDLQGLLALAKTRLEEANTTLEHYRNLVKKGFRTPEQLRAKEQAVKEAEFNYNRDNRKLQVLETWTKKRQLTELNAKAEEAKREVERAKSSSAAIVVKAETDAHVARATADLERKQLVRVEKLLEYCTVRSVADGVVVYAKDKNKRIELGESVHFKQKLFSVPDMTQMQVKAYAHESEVKKIQPGMRAEVSVDAVSNLTLEGTVTEVDSFYDTTRHWLSGGVKDYETIIKIKMLPDAGFKPGMTTQVKIYVGEIENSLIVPVPAVTERAGSFYSFVLERGEFKPRKIVIGANTDQFVEVKEGLQEGDTVALDARRRVQSEFDESNDQTVAQR